MDGRSFWLLLALAVTPAGRAQEVVWERSVAGLSGFGSAGTAPRGYVTTSVGNVDETRVFDTSTGTDVAVVAGRTIAMSPDGRYLAISAGNSSQPRTDLYDLATGGVVATVPFNIDSSGYSLAFAHDSGNMVAIVKHANESWVVTTFALPSLVTGTQIPGDWYDRVFVNQSRGSAYVWDSNGGSADRTLLEYDYVTGAILRLTDTLWHHPLGALGDTIVGLWDGRVLVFSRLDGSVWLLRFPHADLVRAKARVADGLVATATQTEVAVWRVSDGAEIARFQAEVVDERMALCPGRIVIVRGLANRLRAYRFGPSGAGEPRVTGRVQVQGLATPNGEPLLVDILDRTTGASLESHHLDLATDGGFGFTTSVAGPFGIRAKTPNALSARADGPFTAPTELPTLPLRNGDVNGDNSVNIADFLLLRAAYGSSQGTPRYLPGADLDRSGSVAVQDFLLLRRSFGQSGG